PCSLFQESIFIRSIKRWFLNSWIILSISNSRFFISSKFLSETSITILSLSIFSCTCPIIADDDWCISLLMFSLFSFSCNSRINISRKGTVSQGLFGLLQTNSILQRLHLYLLNFHPFSFVLVPVNFICEFFSHLGQFALSLI